MSLTVFAPATIANLGVGFDLLGAAINPVDSTLLGDKITVEALSEPSEKSVPPHDEPLPLRDYLYSELVPGVAGIVDNAETFVELVCCGDYSHCLPENHSENLVCRCAQRFLAELPAERRCSLRLTLEKGLPVGSGLGSSASSIVATFQALNEFFSQPFDQAQLLGFMGEFEGQISGSVHYDNVAPSYLGGLQLMVQAGERFCESLPIFEHWFWIVAYPGTSLSTAKMRALLPEQYERGDVIKFGRYLSGFVHALYRRDQSLALAMLNDVMAEPYRRAHIPGYNRAKAALHEIGILGSGISGSGPTMFAIADDLKVARQAEEILRAVYLAEAGGFVKVCRIDRKGARVIKKEETV